MIVKGNLGTSVKWKVVQNLKFLFFYLLKYLSNKEAESNL